MSPSSWNGRVVVGYDASEASRLAASWAAEEALVLGRGLTLAHAVLPPVAAGGLGIGLPPNLGLVDDLRAQAQRELSELADSLPGTDIDIRVAIGSPSGLLLEASEHAHMLVIGSRGQGGFAGLLLGSVGTQVAAHAECPTVVMRGAPRDAERIVVGVDGSPNSEQALAFAFDLASRHGWDVVAVHAWEVPSYDIIVAPIGEIPIPLSDVADEEVRLAAEVLAGFRTDYPDVTVHEHLVRSAPVDALLDAATDAAMIVVGTRGRGPTLGAVLGSVSNGVLHKAHIPVAVVPYRDPGNTAA